MSVPGMGIRVRVCEQAKMWNTFYPTVQLVGGRGHLDVQPHWVTVLAFPQHKGLMEGCMGLTTDTLLVGRLDGSVGMIDIVDSSSFRRSELQHCSRKDGSCYFING